MTLSQRVAMNSDELSALLHLLETDSRYKLVLTFDSEEEKIQPPMIGQESAAESSIATILRELGIQPHLKGYEYLKTAIKLKSSRGEEMESITKHLYPEVAKRHKTTGGKVEHGIRHAIEGAWSRAYEPSEEDALLKIREKIFGYSSAMSKRKPTN